MILHKYERSNWVELGGAKEKEKKKRKEKRGKVVPRGNSLCLDAAANAFKGFQKSYTA